MSVLNFSEKDWLKDAVPMDTARSSSRRLRCLVDALFEEIAPLITVSSKSRQKEALKTTLMNLKQIFIPDLFQPGLYESEHRIVGYPKSGVIVVILFSGAFLSRQFV
ncbi:MAG: hypothetical protein H8E17_07725 [Deltaproteobacteria bacterium]|nr:hypothetical protein [Deltaproteobacteria bacterium]